MLIFNHIYQIGAVNGSEEFRLGVSINFDMQGRTKDSSKASWQEVNYFLQLFIYGIKRKWGDREGHSGRWLGYVDSTKVIFSFRRKRKSISPDVRMIPFTGWSGNWSRWSAWKYVSSVEAPKEPQPLWNKNAGGMKEYQCLSSESLNQRKQRWQQERIHLLSFVDNMQTSIVLFEVVT